MSRELQQRAESHSRQKAGIRSDRRPHLVHRVVRIDDQHAKQHRDGRPPEPPGHARPERATDAPDRAHHASTRAPALRRARRLKASAETTAAMTLINSTKA